MIRYSDALKYGKIAFRKHMREIPSGPYRSAAQRRVFFCHYYLALGLNGTQAAMATGYKPSNARHYASRLLRRADVRSILADEAKRLCER